MVYGLVGLVSSRKFSHIFALNQILSNFVHLLCVAGVDINKDTT